MTKPVDACVQPAQGPILQSEEPSEQRASAKETPMIRARVGHEAPDFEAAAHVDGGFRNVKLSDFRGKWVVLCFYPGDFTFV